MRFDKSDLTIEHNGPAASTERSLYKIPRSCTNSIKRALNSIWNSLASPSIQCCLQTVRHNWKAFPAYQDPNGNLLHRRPNTFIFKKSQTNGKFVVSTLDVIKMGGKFTTSGESGSFGTGMMLAYIPCWKTNNFECDHEHSSCVHE